MGKSRSIASRCKPVGRVVIGILFIVAGTLKLLDPAQFLSDIQTFQLVPYSVAFAMALMLPWLEVISGIALALKKWRWGAPVLLLGLMIAFTGALIISAGRGLDISCGCFGVNEGNTTNYQFMIMRNVCIITGLVWISWRKPAQLRD